jgi:hypothetical protein
LTRNFFLQISAFSAFLPQQKCASSQHSHSQLTQSDHLSHSSTIINALHKRRVAVTEKKALGVHRIAKIAKNGNFGAP